MRCQPIERNRVSHKARKFPIRFCVSPGPTDIRVVCFVKSLNIHITSINDCNNYVNATDARIDRKPRRKLKGVYAYRNHGHPAGFISVTKYWEWKTEEDAFLLIRRTLACGDNSRQRQIHQLDSLANIQSNPMLFLVDGDARRERPLQRFSLVASWWIAVCDQSPRPLAARASRYRLGRDSYIGVWSVMCATPETRKSSRQILYYVAMVEYIRSELRLQ